MEAGLAPGCLFAYRDYLYAGCSADPVVPERAQLVIGSFPIAPAICTVLCHEDSTTADGASTAGVPLSVSIAALDTGSRQKDRC